MHDLSESETLKLFQKFPDLISMTVYYSDSESTVEIDFPR